MDKTFLIVQKGSYSIIKITSLYRKRLFKRPRSFLLRNILIGWEACGIKCLMIHKVFNVAFILTLVVIVFRHISSGYIDKIYCMLK